MRQPAARVGSRPAARGARRPRRGLPQPSRAWTAQAKMPCRTPRWLRTLFCASPARRSTAKKALDVRRLEGSIGRLQRYGARCRADLWSMGGALAPLRGEVVEMSGPRSRRSRKRGLGRSASRSARRPYAITLRATWPGRWQDRAARRHRTFGYRVTRGRPHHRHRKRFSDNSGAVVSQRCEPIADRQLGTRFNSNLQAHAAAGGPGMVRFGGVHIGTGPPGRSSVESRRCPPRSWM